MKLTDVLGDNAQIKMIQFLTKTKGMLMNLSDVARKTNLSNSTVGRIADELLKIGLIKELKIGNMRVISLNLENKIANILINLVNEIEKA